MISNKIEQNNICKATFKETVPVTLAAASWSNNTYTISDSRITANTQAVLAMGASTEEQYMQMAKARTSRAITCNAGSMTLTAQGEQPTIDIPVTLYIIAW